MEENTEKMSEEDKQKKKKECIKEYLERKKKKKHTHTHTQKKWIQQCVGRSGKFSTRGINFINDLTDGDRKSVEWLEEIKMYQ